MRTQIPLFTVFQLVLSCVALAQEQVPGSAPFSDTPQVLQKAFAGLDHGSHPVTLLLEEVRYNFDEQGRNIYRQRLIFKVWTKEGADAWGMIQRNWAPWLEQRPEVRARVIGPDGTIHELDPKTIAESPARDGDEDLLSDRRMVRVPLPALEPGSIVEQEVVIRQTALTLDAGTVHYFHFGSTVPVQQTRLAISAPESIPLRYKMRLLPELKVAEERNGKARMIVFEQGAMKPLADVLPLLPPDEPRSPHIVFSTAQDWSAVAAGYAAIVEKQLQGFDARQFLPKFKQGATREEKILAIVDKLNREIRYTGIEFSEASVVPRKPAEVLERKYGDCKDKSTLAVAMLRSAGVEAHVALLDSSTGSDIEPDLPGMDVFNHAIVYAPGQPDLWLDPTDPDLRLHVVSPGNQGRYALIASAQTKGLIRTPELTAEQNRLVETREFHLAEIGRAKVTETSETYGIFDREYRGQFGGQDEQKLRETLKSYVEYTYGEAKFAKATTGQPEDLTAPFQLRIELENAQRGSSERAEAAVGIFPPQILNRLPKYLREEQKKEEEEGKSPAPARTQDFYLSEPFTYEWHYVIHMPPGFRVRQVPEPQEEKLGPAIFTAKFSREGADVLRGNFRLVTPKRRFSATEGAALREAAVEFGKRKTMLVYFDQVGEAALAAGNVREALKEFSALRKLHPQEALHATQTAHALLAAGGGESARAEAKRAVAMEPKSAQGYIQLAEVLKNDLVGRSMMKGLDVAGAVAAYRKALELDPSDNRARANLAILLEHDQSGIRYGAGAKLEEAAAEYKKILDKLPSLGVAQNYPIVLFRMGKAQELRDYVKKQPDNETNQTLRVCAEALLNGSKPAIQLAGEISGADAKQRVLTSAAQTLILVRQYELAADLFEAGAAGSQNPAGVANLVQTLRRTKRTEDSTLAIRKPADAVRVLFSRAMRIEEHEKDWMEPLSSLMVLGDGLNTMKEFQRGVNIGRAKLLNSGVGLDVGYDLMQSSAQYVEEGSDETGWVVRATFPGATATGAGQQTWFVRKEEAGYRIIGGVIAYEGIARLVLKLVQAGQLDQAKVWLDRVRQELPAGSGDDPLAAPLFSRLWQQRQPAEAKVLRRAAAALLASEKKDAVTVIPILDEARREADAANSNVLTAMLAEAYFTDRQFSKALTCGEQLLKDLPQSPTALLIALRAAYAANGREGGARLLNSHLDGFKDDTNAVRRAAQTAMLFGDTETAIAVERRIVDSGRAQMSDYNALAWLDLIAGKVTAETLNMANKGVMIAGAETSGLLHTLAAVDAELGKEADARAAILQRIKAMGSQEPDDDDWYVFGRIAEQYGLTQDAAAMYGKVSKPTDDLMIPSTSYGLAQRRLKTMGAATN